MRLARRARPHERRRLLMSPKRKAVVEEPERLLTPEEVCERLGLKPRQLRRQIAEHRIEVVKIGRLNRFRESYIDSLVAEGLPSDGGRKAESRPRGRRTEAA